MTPIEIGKVYKLRNGKKGVVLGAEYEKSFYPEIKSYKPIIFYEIRTEDGEIYNTCESAIESEVI